MKSKKGGKSIRSKIVFGYVGIYILISFIWLVVFACAVYIAGYCALQDYVKSDLGIIMKELPKYDGTNEEELYNIVQSKMPNYVIRYDMIYQKQKILG